MRETVLVLQLLDCLRSAFLWVCRTLLVARAEICRHCTLLRWWRLERQLPFHTPRRLSLRMEPPAVNWSAAPWRALSHPLPVIALKSHIWNTLMRLLTPFSKDNTDTQRHRDSHNHSHSHKYTRAHTHTHDLQIHTTIYTDFSYFDTHLEHISSMLLAFERSQNFFLILSFSPLLVSVCIHNSEIQTFTSLFVPGLF